MTEQCETDFLVADLYKLRDLYEEHAAALEEYQSKKGSMSKFDLQNAANAIHYMAVAIKLFEFNHSKAAAAFRGDDET